MHTFHKDAIVYFIFCKKTIAQNSVATHPLTHVCTYLFCKNNKIIYFYFLKKPIISY